MDSSPYNLLVILGPTASGKTRLGVRLAQTFAGEIISADSRQVYRGLTIGAGKDLDEYHVANSIVPYHLIDVVDLDHEFSVFEYQRRFCDAFALVRTRNALPVVVGGTGLYLEAVLRGYEMVDAPENPDLRAELVPLTHAELVARLKRLNPRPHNITDLAERDRLIRAIEIATATKDRAPQETPDIQPFVLGTRWPRNILRQRIRDRLKTRLENGLIEEVHELHAQGVSWERLFSLGLEYRHVAQFLQGEIKNRNDLFQKLNSAIYQFARRQESWFRRMERSGIVIHWIDQAHFDSARQLVGTAFFKSLEKPSF